MKLKRNKNQQDIKKKVVKPQLTYTFKVNYSNELLNFLLSKINQSRNTVKAILSSKKVLVNGVVITKHNYPLAKDDVIKVSKNPIIQQHSKDIKEKPKDFKGIKRAIIYQDDDFVAINKPHGLLSVESDTDTTSAYYLLQEYLREHQSINRIYQVHRIDKETSGVLIFVKDIKLHSMLKMKWNDLVTKRQYYAVIKGKLSQKSGVLKNYLDNNQNNIVYVTNNMKHGKLAITNYEVIAQSKDYSLVKIEIDTGRKNQIRVQFAHIGHPIIGDDKYGDSTNPIKRLALHASQLDFIHPITNQHMSIYTKVPQQFLKLFDLK